MSAKPLRDKWAEISFPQKVTWVVALFGPVAAPLVVYALIGGDQPEAPPKRRTTNLGVVALEVEATKTVRFGKPFKLPRLDLTLRNSGNLVWVVTGVKVTILDFGRIEPCEAGGGGHLDVSHTYPPIQLPDEPETGEEIVMKVRQQVDPNDTDRFVVPFEVPEWEGSLGTYIDQLQIALLHDGASTPLFVGEAVVPVPGLPFPWNLDPPEAASASVAGECWDPNRDTFLRMLQLDGEVPDGFDAGLLEAPEL
jgi:hypothetical protein